MILLVEDSITVKSQKKIEDDDYKASWGLECENDIDVRINQLHSDGVYNGYISQNGKIYNKSIFLMQPIILCRGRYKNIPSVFLLDYWDFLCKLNNVNGKLKPYYFYGSDEEKQCQEDKEYLLELKKGQFEDKIIE